MVDWGAQDVLQSVLDRPALVELLRNGAFDRHDIERTLDVSRSTAHRVVHELRDYELIDRTDGGYEATPLGDVVVEESQRCRTVVDTALNMHPLLEVVESNGRPLPIEAFLDAEIVEDDRNSPEIEERLVELVTTADSIRCASKTVVSHRFLAAIFERTRGDATVDIVTTEDVIEFVRTTHPAMSEFSDVSNSISVSIAESIPFFLAITDECAYIGVYNREPLRIDVLIQVEDDTAISWAETCFEAFKADSIPPQCGEPDTQQT